MIGLLACSQNKDLEILVVLGENDLVFNDLAKIWDKGMPIEMA